MVELLAMIREEKMKMDVTAEELLSAIVLSLVLERQQQTQTFLWSFTLHTTLMILHTQGSVSKHRHFYMQGNFVIIECFAIP